MDFNSRIRFEYLNFSEWQEYVQEMLKKTNQLLEIDDALLEKETVLAVLANLRNARVILNDLTQHHNFELNRILLDIAINRLSCNISSLNSKQTKKLIIRNGF